MYKKGNIGNNTLGFLSITLEQEEVRSPKMVLRKPHPFVITHIFQILDSWLVE